MLKVGLIGCMHARIDGRPHGLGFGGASRSLAAFLFANIDQLHRRNKLADMFWPDLDEVKASAALNSALWRIKNQIFARWNLPCTAVQSTTDYVAILKEEFFEVDLAILEMVSRSVLEADMNTLPISDDVVRHFIEYDGTLFEGESGDWVLEQRERVNSNFIRAGMKMARFRGLLRDYDCSLDICRNLLTVDPYREKLVRYTMALLAAAERREEALRKYQEWRTLIGEELAIDPLASTVQVSEKIMAISSEEDANLLLQETLGD